MNQSESIGKLSLALSKAQAQIRGAKKDSLNPFFKSSYSDLASVWDACRDPLTSNELAIIQTIHKDEFALTLKTVLSHSSGEWISSDIPVLISGGGGKQDMQALGSAITYARRYGLSAIAGICPDDDDGEAAMNRNIANKQPTKHPTLAAAAAAPKVSDIDKHLGIEFNRLTNNRMDAPSVDYIKKVWTSVSTRTDAEKETILKHWKGLSLEGIHNILKEEARIKEIADAQEGE
jgi:hypothetical protein